MVQRLFPVLLVAATAASFSCQSDHDKVKETITQALAGQPGTFAVAFKDLSNGEEIFINERMPFHAASTMKTPVMIEVFKQAAEGKFSLNDSIVIKNEFKSIVDGSPYSLTEDDDSEFELYRQIGKKRTLQSLVYEMITVSSNLATNIVIEWVDAKKVTQTMRDLGAKDIQVLRGVEDDKAFQEKLNNTVTAYDLMLIFEKLAKGEVVNPEASKAMIAILLDQKYNDIIPAKLPRDVKVAHKTGWIKGLHHDSALVILPDGRQYVLVLLSKDLKDEKAAVETLNDVSKTLYDYMASRKK
ncbi:MAG TPA: serine hydrolase [Chryseolinea sp.]